MSEEARREILVTALEPIRRDMMDEDFEVLVDWLEEIAIMIPAQVGEHTWGYIGGGKSMDEWTEVRLWQLGDKGKEYPHPFRLKGHQASSDCQPSEYLAIILPLKDANDDNWPWREEPTDVSNP